MKKFFILGLLIFSLVLTGCNNLESKEDSETDKIVQKPIPNKIFDRKIINSRISENELKKSIKIYLDKNEELSEASEYYEDKVDSEEPLNKSEINKLNKINNLIKHNDENFREYIQNNTLPKDYNKETLRISEYISNSNKFNQNLDTKIDQAINKSTDQKKVSTKNIDEIKDDSKKVNGKEQAKIEKFLKDKNIKTKAFKK